MWLKIPLNSLDLLDSKFRTYRFKMGEINDSPKYDYKQQDYKMPDYSSGYGTNFLA